MNKKKEPKTQKSKQGNTSKQSLQKFTDFENIKTLEQFKELKETDPKTFDKTYNWLCQKVTDEFNRDTPVANELDRYFNRLENCLEAYGVTEESKKVFKRQRWYINEHKIKVCIHKTLKDKGYLPDNTEISNETGLSRVTVTEHIKSGALSEFKQEEREKYKMLNTKALEMIYRIGIIKEDVRALKIFVDLTREDPAEASRITNNYIQINNTKIDNLLINQLPEEVRLQIETLVLSNLPETKQLPAE